MNIILKYNHDGRNVEATGNLAAPPITPLDVTVLYTGTCSSKLAFQCITNLGIIS